MTFVFKEVGFGALVVADVMTGKIDSRNLPKGPMHWMASENDTGVVMRYRGYGVWERIAMIPRALATALGMEGTKTEKAGREAGRSDGRKRRQPA